MQKHNTANSFQPASFDYLRGAQLQNCHKKLRQQLIQQSAVKTVCSASSCCQTLILQIQRSLEQDAGGGCPNPASEDYALASTVDHGNAERVPHCCWFWKSTEESVSLSGTAGGETGGEREGFPSVLVKAAAWWQRGLAGGTGLAGDESRRTEAAQPRSEAGPCNPAGPCWSPTNHPQFAQTAGS